MVEIKVIKSPWLAEALALKDGMNLAWNRGYRKVICEVDCRELTKAIVDVGNMRRHAHAEVFLEINELMERSWCIRVAWIHREANFPADWRAGQGAASVDQGLTELINSRPELDLLLLKDRLAVP
ncbi:uncharacterized protein LOC130737162 [Lotus japonicus]|uniref:uncharacterized protein LOC130737162 n=1 Tax=Lotus japonicus TaxID=34305 RepID=UPI00258F0C18|nr:uncharacterized protein LOC130737162 [Lotus japonicus]